MLSAFVKDESGGVVIAYGVLALVFAVAIVSVAGMVGSVMGHSYSAIPDQALERIPSMGGHSQAAGYTDSFELGEMIRLSGVGM